MGWREELQPARFRNAAFHVELGRQAGGRRTAVHEYPEQDKPFVEDLGGKAETWRITAFVIGDGYKTARDALRSALREYGPGVLVHPLHGQISLQVQDWELSETTEQGGYAEFAITFVEPGEQQFPQSGYDTRSRVSTASDRAFDASRLDFVDRLNLRGPGFLSDSAATALRDALGGLGRMAGGLSPTDAALRSFDLADLTEGLPGLLGDTAGLALRLGNAYLGLRSLSPASRISGYRGFGSYGSSLPGVSPTAPLEGTNWRTSSRRQEASNNLAIAEVVQRFALIESARAGSEMDFETYDDAIAWRDDIGDRLDAASEAATSDTVFDSLRDLRIETMRDIDQRAVNKPSLRQVQPPEVMPAAVLAYRLFGDATRGEEIAIRNGVPHPGFVPPTRLSVPNR